MALSFWQKIKEIALNPGGFFDKIQEEQGYKEALLYLLYMELIVFIPGLLVLYYTSTESLAFASLAYLFVTVFGLAMFAVVILIYSLAVRLFGGKQGILRTLQAFIYGSTAAVLLSWIPYVNIAAAVYSLYAAIIGLIKLQKMEPWKAVLAYLLPIIILSVIAILITSAGIVSAPAP